MKEDSRNIISIVNVKEQQSISVLRSVVFCSHIIIDCVLRYMSVTVFGVAGSPDFYSVTSILLLNRVSQNTILCDEVISRSILNA